MTDTELAIMILSFKYNRNKRTKFILKDSEGSRLKTVDIPSRYVIDKRWDVVKRALEILTQDHILDEYSIEIEEI